MNTPRHPAVIHRMRQSRLGEVTTFVWGTNLPLNARTVCRVASRGGRLRWPPVRLGCGPAGSEEPGRSKTKARASTRTAGTTWSTPHSENTEAAKNYYTLLQIAQIIELLIRKGSLVARAIGGSVKKVTVHGLQRRLPPRAPRMSWRLPSRASLARVALEGGLQPVRQQNRKSIKPSRRQDKNQRRQGHSCWPCLYFCLPDVRRPGAVLGALGGRRR